MEGSAMAAGGAGVHKCVLEEVMVPVNKKIGDRMLTRQFCWGVEAQEGLGIYAGPWSHIRLSIESPIIRSTCRDMEINGASKK